MSVSKDIDKLISFCKTMKGKSPDYCLLSKELYVELSYELQAPNIQTYKGLEIITTHYAGKDFLQLGYGTTR